MSRKCPITKRKHLTGNAVSHSNNRNKRIQSLNMIKKRIWVTEQNRFVTVKISVRALKTINKKGAGRVLSKAGLL
jgi:large subunit ribosomal protein L28